MSEVKPNARDIFCAALEHDSLAEQDKYRPSDDQLRRLDASVFVDVESIGEPNRAAKPRIVLIESYSAYRLAAVHRCHSQFQMALPDDPPIGDRKIPLKHRLRKSGTPGP